MQWLEAAVRLAQDNEVQGVVTGPIHKATAYGRAVAERYREEIGGVDGARTKVRGVP